MAESNPGSSAPSMDDQPPPKASTQHDYVAEVERMLNLPQAPPRSHVPPPLFDPLDPLERLEPHAPLPKQRRRKLKLRADVVRMGIILVATAVLAVAAALSGDVLIAATDGFMPWGAQRAQGLMTPGEAKAVVKRFIRAVNDEDIPTLEAITANGAAADIISSIRFNQRVSGLFGDLVGTMTLLSLDLPTAPCSHCTVRAQVRATNPFGTVTGETTFTLALVNGQPVIVGFR